MTVTVTVELAFDRLKVRINGALHVSVSRSKLLGVQGWVERDRFIVEYVMVGGSLLSEYDDRDKWAAVLAGLDEHF